MNIAGAIAGFISAAFVTLAFSTAATLALSFALYSFIFWRLYAKETALAHDIEHALAIALERGATMKHAMWQLHILRMYCTTVFYAGNLLVSDG